MKLLLTHPFCWPYVRRGAERYLADIAEYLASRGHSVTVLTMKPGPSEECVENGVRWVRRHQINSAWLNRFKLRPERLFFLRCLPFLLRERFDLVHCLYFIDGCAARLAGRLTDVPYALSMFGIMTRELSMHNLTLKYAIRGARQTLVVSEAARRSMVDAIEHDPVCIPPPCRLDRFVLNTKRDLSRPRLLSVASFDEPRKGAHVLAQAFLRVKETVPGAVLQYSGQMSQNVRDLVIATVGPDIARDVEFLSVGEIEDLPKLYAQAAVTVLPSLWEAFGMVLVESLACGTPVVGTRHGGIPEIVSDGIGYAFEAGTSDQEPTNVAGLADAIIKALALHRHPDLPQRCRQHASQFSLETVGAHLESFYESQLRCSRKLAPNRSAVARP